MTSGWLCYDICYWLIPANREKACREKACREQVLSDGGPLTADPIRPHQTPSDPIRPDEKERD